MNCIFYLFLTTRLTQDWHKKKIWCKSVKSRGFILREEKRATQ